MRVARTATSLFTAAAAWFANTARAMHAAVGLADYDRYVAHLQREHPEQPIPTRDAFFRERQDARYARGAKPPCC